MSMEWDGKERRQSSKMDLELRDKIIDTHSKVASIIKWMESHDTKDDKRFEDLIKDNHWRDKVLYGGLGGIAVLTFILNWFHH